MLLVIDLIFNFMIASFVGWKTGSMPAFIVFLVISWFAIFYSKDLEKKIQQGNQGGIINFKGFLTLFIVTKELLALFIAVLFNLFVEYLLGALRSTWEDFLESELVNWFSFDNAPKFVQDFLLDDPVDSSEKLEQSVSFFDWLNQLGTVITETTGLNTLEFVVVSFVVVKLVYLAFKIRSLK